MTHREETEAIRRILLGICEKWKAEEEPVDLAETVILRPGGSPREEKSHSPFSSTEKDREFITETVLLSPKERKGTSSVPSGMVPAGEDILAETVILGREREPKPKTKTKTERDGNRQ